MVAGSMVTGTSGANHMNQALVFDIGLHNGDDTSYYLDLGYRVVGVEANPLLASRCTQQLIAEHGKPFFMKVDIEGTDFQTLCSITPATSPTLMRTRSWRD
jgi:hypothetical protein